MPRTDTVTAPGCPPFRAIICDSLGLVKVLENSADNGHPQVIARWGEPDPCRSIVGACLSSDDNPMLALARKNHMVEILDSSTGVLRAQLSASKLSANSSNSTSNGIDCSPVIGVYLSRPDSTGLRSTLTCTAEGDAILQGIHLEDVELVSSHETDDTVATWKVCKSGSILCFKVDNNEKFAAFGGNGAEVSLWDLNNSSKVWEAKAPRRDNTGLMSPAFVTTATFLASDHRKIVVGTGHHQIRLYDVSAQRRPILSVDYLESPIKAVEADADNHHVFVGTGNGDLASFDMRTGKLLGTFKGRCSGSIRSISRHPSLPVIAACGLDRYVRIFQISTRQLLSRVFLKQQLVAVIFDNKPLTSSTSVMKGTEGTEGDYEAPVQHVEQKKRNKKGKALSRKVSDTKLDNLENTEANTFGVAVDRESHLENSGNHKRVQKGEKAMQQRKKKKLVLLEV